MEIAIWRFIFFYKDGLQIVRMYSSLIIISVDPIDIYFRCH